MGRDNPTQILVVLFVHLVEEFSSHPAIQLSHSKVEFEVFGDA